MTPLYVMRTPEILVLLAFLFACTLAPMFFLSRLMPSLVPEDHPKSRWMDGLRGVAAALVSLNHAPLVLINLAIVPQVFYLDIPDSEILKLFGAIGVQIFFCITGLLFAGKILSGKPVDWADFYAKRVRRIVPVFFVAGTLAVIIAAWFSWPITQESGEIIAALPAVFSFGLLHLPTIDEFNFGRLLGVVWTLAIEWRFYFVLPIIFIAVTKSRSVTFTAIILFAFIDLALNGLSAWVYFMPGALCSLIASKPFSRLVRSAAALVAVAATVFMFYRLGLKPNYGLEQWLTVSVLFIALTISRPGVLSAKMFVAMGTVSYSFYLLHAMLLFLVFGSVHFYWTDVSLLSVNQFAVLAGGTLGLISIVSTVSYVMVERRFMHKAGGIKAKSFQDGRQPA